MLNKVHLIGRVGGDPETNYTQGGTAITKCTLATSEKWKDKNSGEVQERTEWHRLTFFGRIAEVVAEYVKKGSLIYVEGKLHYGEYTDREGIKRYTTEVQCDGMKLLESKKDRDGEQRERAPARGPQSPPAGARAPAPAGDFDEDDIPF